LRPDGLDHPPTPRTPELTSSTRSFDHDDDSTDGDKYGIPMPPIVITVAVDVTIRPSPPPRSPLEPRPRVCPLRPFTSRPPSPQPIMNKKVICSEEEPLYSAPWCIARIFFTRV